MKPLTPKERILKERGLQQTRSAPKKHIKFAPASEFAFGGKSKTPLMMYLEEKYHHPIEELLLSGSLAVVANRLGGEVDVTTLSKWIKKFKLRYSEDNLPQCEGCRHSGVACQEGICYVLMDKELYELVPIKRKEVLGNGN